jgi:mono/diheme cytochrome c family protein
VNPDDRPGLQCSVTDIITYGRAGTPMPAWGVIGGGAKNDQSIQDLIAYLRSIQLTPEQAQAQAQKDLDTARKAPQDAIKLAESTLKTDQATLDTARKAAQKALGQPDATDRELTAACNEINNQVEKNPSKVNRDQGTACRAYTSAATTVAQDENALAWTKTWALRRANVSDGQLLFENNCARCHTAGWSSFDPTVPPDQPGGLNGVGKPGSGGGLGGGIGFDLGNEIGRFGTDESGGFDAQVKFVTDGSQPFKEYGHNGNGTGKMPGFGQMLTPKMIKEVVAYERYCLSQTTYTSVQPYCPTPPAGRVPPTTTTTKPGG